MNGQHKLKGDFKNYLLQNHREDLIRILKEDDCEDFFSVTIKCGDVGASIRFEPIQEPDSGYIKAVTQLELTPLRISSA